MFEMQIDGTCGCAEGIAGKRQGRGYSVFIALPPRVEGRIFRPVAPNTVAVLCSDPNQGAVLPRVQTLRLPFQLAPERGRSGEDLSDRPQIRRAEPGAGARAEIGIAAPRMDSWGSTTNLGGDVQCMGAMVQGAPDDLVSCASFGVTKGCFRMTYSFDKDAVVVEGSVTLTDEETGQSTTFTVGNGWFARKGTKMLWEVTSERFVEHYLSVV